MASVVRTLLRPASLLAPLNGSDRIAPAIGDFYIWASGGSVTLPAARYDYNSDWTPLLAGLSPAGIAASLAALAHSKAVCPNLEDCVDQLSRRTWPHSSKVPDVPSGAHDPGPRGLLALTIDGTALELRQKNKWPNKCPRHHSHYFV